jgi:hypothetical protein
MGMGIVERVSFTVAYISTRSPWSANCQLVVRSDYQDRSKLVKIREDSLVLVGNANLDICLSL